MTQMRMLYLNLIKSVLCSSPASRLLPNIRTDPSSFCDISFSFPRELYFGFNLVTFKSTQVYSRDQLQSQMFEPKVNVWSGGAHGQTCVLTVHTRRILYLVSSFLSGWKIVRLRNNSPKMLRTKMLRFSLYWTLHLESSVKCINILKVERKMVNKLMEVQEGKSLT